MLYSKSKIVNRRQAIKPQTSPATTAKFQKILKRGQLLFMEGDTGREMFIVKSGKVKIIKQEGDASIVLATLGPGSVLGEMSLLDNAPRSATAQISEDTAVTVIDDTILEAAYKKIPTWLVMVIKIVVKRLRETTEKNAKDLIQNNIGGVLEIIVQLQTLGPEDRDSIPLKELKETALKIIGLSFRDTDKILNELILKEMIRFGEDQTSFDILQPAPLQLYLEFLKAKTLNKALPGAELSTAGRSTLAFLMDLIQDPGRRKDGNYILLPRPVLDVEVQKRKMGRSLDPEGLGNLVDHDFIKIMGPEGKDGFNPMKNYILGVDPDHAERTLLIQEWVPIFEADLD